MSAPSSSTTASATPYASASLYVGDLAPDVTESLLFEIFNGVGPVSSVRVCRDVATRRSLGYAYVNFHRVEDAERALDTMNFSTIRNRPCRIMWSHRDPSLRKSGTGNIFVKNLAKSIENKNLFDTFSLFGNILSCKVAVNSKRESLGYGFVHYESEEAAQNAINRVNGMIIEKQKVIVQPFKSKKDRGGLDKTKFTNVYVKNLPEDMTKEEMDALFTKHGEITSSMIVSSDDGKSRGFGFINFASPDDAAAAIEALNRAEIRGKTLYVAKAQKKEERERELRDRFEQLKLERQKQYAGVNLYVKNLADGIDDARLRSEFSKFGDISSAKVMIDSNSTKSRGFGFVCFATPDEATKAVTEMNGKMLDGKPLYVALAQRKEVRRAQLEAQYAARAQRGMAAPGPMYAQGPMYYAPPVQGMPQRMVYPQQMVTRPGRWNPQQQRQPAPQMMGHPMYNLGGMPINGRGGPQGNGSQAGQAGPRSDAHVMPDNAVGRQRGQNQNFKYTPNARNRDASQAAQVAAGALAQGPPQVMLAAQTPLTIQALAAAPEEQQKQIIGERLFPLIQQQEPGLAGKITGMLLEMDNGELLHLLESAEARNEKIQEALQVLHQHQETQGDE